MPELNPGKDYIGVSVFALIYNRERSKILLVKHKPSEKKGSDYANVWGMPGGTVEYGEKLEDALRREVKEETNLALADVEFVNCNDYIKTVEKKHWVAINFIATADEKDLKNLEPEKFAEMKFFSFNKLPSKISKFTKEIFHIKKIL